MAEKALELIGKNIRLYVADRSNVEAAEQMLVGSLFAGIAFSWARLGDVHAMSHPVSAYYNVAHGVANAILLPVVLKYNALADQGKYLKIYNYISELPECAEQFIPDMLVRKIRQLNGMLGIPESLGAVGVTEEHLDAMADDAMKSGNIAVNPRKTEKKDILELYRSAM
jgi:alcohol dehydrogenase